MRLARKVAWRPGPRGALLLIALLAISACGTSTSAPRASRPVGTAATPTPTATLTAASDDLSQWNLYGASVYFSNAVSVRAVDGAVRWKIPLTGVGCPLQSPPPATPPVVVAGVVYFASVPCGALVALRANDGGLIWQTHIPQGLSGTDLLYAPSLAVAGGLIYTAGSDQTCAWHAGDGSQAWCHPLPGDVTAPTYADGILYLGYGHAQDAPGGPTVEYSVRALRASDGGELWHTVIPTVILGPSAPTVVDGMIYVGAKDGVFALRASDGALLWHQLAGIYAAAAPVVVNGTLYASAEGTVVALDATTGAVKWRTPLLGVLPGARYSSVALAVDADHVYVDLERIHALNAADGSLAWDAGASDGIAPAGPIDIQAFAGYVLTRIGLLRGSDGSVVWTRPTDPRSGVGPPAGIAP